MNYNTIPSTDVIEKTVVAIQTRNVAVTMAEGKKEALSTLAGLIPAGAEVMTGSSTTLEEIGFVELLKSGEHPWKNLKNEILAEKDPARQAELRKKSVTAQYFIGSVQAITEDGAVLVASNSGSQIPSYAFSSDNVIWVVGAQKIVPTLEDGFRRIREYVLPREDQRMKDIGYGGSFISKLFIFEREIMPNRKIHLILVNEVLGF